MSSKIRKIKESKIKKRKTKWKVFMFLILSVGGIISLYRAPVFNIKDITFTGLKTLKEETLKDVVSDEVGKNIFSVDYNSIKEKLLMNPYITNISIERGGINRLNINIQENDIAFYIDGDTKKVINSKFIVVEELESIEDKNLVKLLGLNSDQTSVGDKVSNDENIINAISEFYSIIEAMPQEYRFSLIDLSHIESIKGQIGDVEIKLGNMDDIRNKMNLVLNSLEQNILTKGYIDMSFNGPPVIKQVE